MRNKIHAVDPRPTWLGQDLDYDDKVHLGIRKLEIIMVVKIHKVNILEVAVEERILDEIFEGVKNNSYSILVLIIAFARSSSKYILLYTMASIVINLTLSNFKMIFFYGKTGGLL